MTCLDRLYLLNDFIIIVYLYQNKGIHLNDMDVNLLYVGYKRNIFTFKLV